MSESTVRQYLLSAGVEAEQLDAVICQLVNLTFLGLEVSSGKFAYSDERKELQKNAVLAARFSAQNLYEKRYEINAPFRAYLELDDSATMMPFE